MAFPLHIERVLVSFGISPELKAGLYDHWLALGDLSLEAFADAVDGGQPFEEAVQRLPRLTAELYLRTYHHLWRGGAATQAFWKPRAEGSSGVVMPLGSLPSHEGFAGRLAGALSLLLGADQPSPSGIITVSKNGHFGGRPDTISFDLVVEPLEAAIAVATAEGRQHTVPGSVGETSGTVDEDERLALIWEIQPNVLKPGGERNRAIDSQWRHHRNWHRVTLATALLWLLEREYRVAIVSGAALRDTHEVNRDQPISEAIMAHHDRTIEGVVAGLGLALAPTGGSFWEPLMNHGLRQRLLAQGDAGLLREVRSE